MPAAPGLLADWNAASRNTAVSKPSRSTARNAITTRVATDPPAIASAAFDSRSPLMVRAFLRIHRIIQVTMPTASSPTIVSRPSCCFWGRLSSATRSATATAAQSARAPATPSHTHLSASRRP